MKVLGAFGHLNLLFQLMTKWQLDNQRRYNDYQREILYLNQNLDAVSIFNVFVELRYRHF